MRLDDPLLLSYGRGPLTRATNSTDAALRHTAVVGYGVFALASGVAYGVYGASLHQGSVVAGIGWGVLGAVLPPGVLPLWIAVRAIGTRSAG